MWGVRAQTVTATDRALCCSQSGSTTTDMFSALLSELGRQWVCCGPLYDACGGLGA